MKFTVAIDGPAASGKGTIARRIAAEFGFAHLDTGLLYRAVAAKGGDPVAAAKGFSSDDLVREGLRSEEAGKAASVIAALPDVRDALRRFQQDFARREGGAVLDGRDIGTVICPMAEVKLYVTATQKVRAHRRWLELGGSEADRLKEVRERDQRDQSRAASPLTRAKDALLLDTSALGIAEACERALALVRKRLSAMGLAS